MNKIDLILNEAQQLFDNEKYSEAAAKCHQLLSVTPLGPRGLHLLGLIYFHQEKYHVALDLIELAIENKPEKALYWAAKGQVELALNQPKNSRQCLLRALELMRQKDTDKKARAKVLFNIGNCYLSEGKFKRAETFYKKVMSLKTEDFHKARYNCAEALFFQGDYKTALKMYESRKHLNFEARRTGEFCSGSEPWKGQDLKGKTILVYNEQGLGDAIQLIRFIPLLKKQGCKVIYEARPPIVPLLDIFSDDIDQVITRRTDGRPSIQCDYHTPYMSLPHYLGTTLENLPADPYINSVKERVQVWQPWIENACTREGPIIGLVWAGKVSIHTDLRHRSFKLKEFYPYISKFETVNWVGMQKGKSSEELDFLPEDHSITNLGNEFDDFSDTAAAIELVDLVISMDTSVAHLAGAMGKPTWLLVSHPPSWRWMARGEKTPWYPSIKIFREERGEGWEAVFERVAQALDLYVADYKAV